MKSIIYASGGGRRALTQWRTERAANKVGAMANKSVAKTGTPAAKAVVAGLRGRAKTAPRPNKTLTIAEIQQRNDPVHTIPGEKERRYKRNMAKANKTVAKVPKGETLASSYRARAKKMGMV